MHPNWGLATSLLAHDPLSSLAYPSYDHPHPPLVASKFPMETRRWPIIIRHAVIRYHKSRMHVMTTNAIHYAAKKLPGFRHIYQLDMTVPKRCCPDALQLHTSNSLRLCGKKTGTSCNSITIPTYGKSYQEVRGVVRAYQFDHQTLSTPISKAKLTPIMSTVSA